MPELTGVQGSDEWFAARRGIPSASNFHKIITPTGKPSKGLATYADELVLERLGVKGEVYINEAMQRGTELEPEARDHYEWIAGADVTEHGFFISECGRYGCSPDGTCSETLGLEIKCPQAKTMIGYIRDPEALIRNYYAQVQGCMLVMGYEKWDLFAYHPDLDHVLVRVERDEEFILVLQGQLDILAGLLITGEK